MLKEKHVYKVLAIILIALTIGIVPSIVAGQTPKRGGSFKIISTQGDVRSLGPAPEVRLVHQLFYAQPAIETLLKWNEKGESAPNLAKSWKIAPDLKSITFFLREGVKFHDGTDFDAEAVKFNIDLFVKAGRMDLAGISSTDVLDKHTIRMNLNPFNSALITNLAYVGGLMYSPTAVKKMGTEEFGRNPVGTGPFKFKSWKSDQSIKYERFDGYWQKGKPYVDEIEILHIKDQMTAVSSFMAGQGDAVWGGVPLQQAAQWQKSGEYNVRRLSYLVDGLVSDNANPTSPFAKLKVRQAISHAIDPKAINDSIFFGLYDVSNQFSGTKRPYYNKDAVGYPYDPAKAKKLLAEAGYPNGFKTNLWGWTIGDYPQWAAAIQAYLKEVGIDVEVNLLELSAWGDLCRKGWTNGLLFYGNSAIVPDDLRSMMYFQEKYKFWKSMDVPKEIEDLILKAVSQPDFNAKVSTLREVNRLLTDKYCLVNFMLISSMIGVIKKDVHDSGLFEIALVQFNPADVYLSR